MATVTPDQLLALLSARLEPRGLPVVLGGRVVLAEGVIHHQDIRGALGRPRVVPAERLLTALRWALLGPDIGGIWRIRPRRPVSPRARMLLGNPLANTPLLEWFPSFGPTQFAIGASFGHTTL